MENNNVRNNSIGSLRVDEKGNRICIMNEGAVCGKCGTSLKSNEVVYLCSLSKEVYCSKCEHSKTYWGCKNPSMVSEHIDWYSILKIEKEGKKDGK